MSFGVGFTLRSNHNEAHRPEYSDGNYLYIKAEQLSRIILDKNKCSVNELEYFYRSSNDNIFKAPQLLIKKGIKKSPVVAFNCKNTVFNNSILGISGNKSQEKLLKNIGAFLLSNLTTYYLFLQSSRWGIERGELYKDDYSTLPVIQDIINSNMWQIYDRAIEKLTNNEDNVLNSYEENTQFFYEKVNQEIADIFNLNEYEISLIDYVRQVSIPLFRNEDRPLKKVKEEEIREYANILGEHFKSRFENLNKEVRTDIYLNHYYVCVYFTIKDKEDEGNNCINITEDYRIEKLIDRLGSLSYEQLTSELFVKKDIKGFEREGFYVIKTNEYKNWHRAIAYRDINEFMDSILESGKKKVKNNHG